MTRIIGGRAGGRSLATPRGPATRPTSDRVREALFSILQARAEIEGAQVLDLYAGSGALGRRAGLPVSCYPAGGLQLTGALRIASTAGWRMRRSFEIA